MIPFYFIALASLFVVSLHFLFYSRVIKKIIVPAKIKKPLTLLVVINLLLNLHYVASRYSDSMVDNLYYLSSLSVGITFVLLLWIIIHEVLHFFHTKLKFIDKSKRDFFKKSGDGLILAASTAYVATASYEGRKQPVINVIRLDLFDFSIVQISDLHIGGLIDRAFVKNSVEKINALKPDLVFMTGDLIDTKIGSVSEAVKELNAIESKYGIYGVLGNHEYFHNPLEIIEFLNDTKIKMLLNENIIIDEIGLNIVGVTDLFGYKIHLLEPDINKAFEGINSYYKTILLAHQPKFIEELGVHKPELILSGHTHGGQIFPFNYLVRLQQPFVKGLHKLPNGSLIYVNSGIGFWGPPMRLGSQAEIAYFI